MKQKRFWKNIARWSIYFVVASFFGHWLEIVVQMVIKLFGAEGTSYGIGAQPFEPYPVYGLAVFGMVALWQVVPEKLKKNVLLAFIFLTGICSIAEYLVGWASAWWHGGLNPYWNYADKPMNLHGHICLQNAVLFGIAATAFMLLVFPRTEKLLDKLPKKALYATAIVLWVVFWICHLLFGA